MFEPSRPDVTLLPNRGAAWFADRLFRSRGTAPAAHVEPGLSSWLPRARLPQGPWQPLRPRDVEPMLDARAPRASTVAVTRLPDDLTRRAQTLGANAWQPELRTLAPWRDDPQSRALMRDVAEFLRNWTAYGARPQDVFLSGGRGGHATTCWSGGEAAWVGLHVDDWRNKPPSERAFSPNRLMLNAGTQPRHLVFMDRTVAAMALELNRFRTRLGQAPISLRSG
ncbi:MAG: hypothetical protein MUF34_27120 [Polyangiaceae bacterium]|nr:hypothetical protein [Polyangiaceae bacterium]